MPRNTYIPVKNRAIGRGKHMDNVVLKKVLLFACKHRPCELEKVMGLKHGTAVRACAKVRELNLTQERIGAIGSFIEKDPAIRNKGSVDIFSGSFNFQTVNP